MHQVFRGGNFIQPLWPTRVWMWHFGTRFCGEHTSAGIIILEIPYNLSAFMIQEKVLKLSISSLHVDQPYGKEFGNLQHVILMCKLCSKYILCGHCRLQKNCPSWKGLWGGEVKGLCSARAWSKMDIREAAEAGCRGEQEMHLSVLKVVGLGDCRVTLTPDFWSRKMRLVVFTQYWVFFFKVRRCMAKHPGSLGKRNLFVKKHTPQSCKVSQYWEFPMAEIKTSAKSKCKYRKRGGKSESVSSWDTWQTQKDKTSPVLIARI